jgi:transcription-repair coupling factor (superfamily II helicase)
MRKKGWIGLPIIAGMQMQPGAPDEGLQWPIPRPASRAALHRPPGCGESLLLARYCASARSEGAPVLVLATDALQARRLVEEISWFDPSLRVCALPDRETLAYDAISPHPDLVSERLETLYRLIARETPPPPDAVADGVVDGDAGAGAQERADPGPIEVLVVAAASALTRLAPPAFVAGRTFLLAKGQQLDAGRLRSRMVLAGYQHVTQVAAPGEFAQRGGLVDIFPMGARVPYRLELSDTTLDSIRTFDPDTQRSLYPVPGVRLLPGREFPFDEAARTAFRGRWREAFEGDPSRATAYRDAGNGIAAAGIEYYLPLFFDGCATIFDYLDPATRVVLEGDIAAATRAFHGEVAERYRFLSRDTERPCLPPARLFVGVDEFFAALKPFARLALVGDEPVGTPAAAPSGADPAPESPAASGVPDAGSAQAGVPAPAGAGTTAPESDAPAFSPLPELSVDRRAADPLHRLRAWCTGFAGRVLIAADSPGRRETIGQLLADHGLPASEAADYASFLAGEARLALAVAPLHEGACLARAGLAILTEAELYRAPVHRQRDRGRERASSVDAMVRDLAELRIGDPVVHAEHGIGRYLGLATLDLGDGQTEFLHLAYAHEATLYIPVAQLHLIGRYSGADPESAPLHALGTGDWERARRKAARQVRDAAAELLHLYALRAARKGHAFEFPEQDYRAFAQGFGFDETPDQQAAIDAVIHDMRSGAPMDRLVCGDVGFGKTEVALRAAFAAVAGGRQVAVLCPTTLLAEQHAQTFRDRFAPWPIRVCELSRFRSPKEVAEALAGLKAGAYDIAIGTHRLLSPDVAFARLGLVVIDEEHRFGVRQKERLKALRTEVDVLTLTATPIPRTLAMSLEGIRDFSVIATAPQRRLAIKTLVRPWSAGLVREACLREMQRGGQVYYLYNEVETIENTRARLAALLPQARIGVAHGQMPERELERVMHEFYQQRFHILLCTTIIETGIDVPTANTILIHRADRFGLAQLHQLRGRVGRSHHQAYAYLLVEEGAATKNALKRLDVIQSLEELGSGFYLAMHDLEIRGAGEVLGDSQSGEVQQVGFDLYSQMLNTAVRDLRRGREPDLLAPMRLATEINLHEPAFLPPDFIADVHQRLALYKQLASATDGDALLLLREEIVDRFGRLPPPALALVETHGLRIEAERVGVRRIDAGPGAMVLHFVPNPPIDTGRLLALVKADRRLRLAGPDRLRAESGNAEREARLRQLRQLLAALAATMA